jgi:hypothetical protein
MASCDFKSSAQSPQGYTHATVSITYITVIIFFRKFLIVCHHTEATGQTRRVIRNKGLLIMLSRQLPISRHSRRLCKPQQELSATLTRSRILNSMWAWLRLYAIISHLSKLLHAINALKRSQKWMTSSKQSRSKSRGSKTWSEYLKTLKIRNLMPPQLTKGQSVVQSRQTVGESSHLMLHPV